MITNEYVAGFFDGEGSIGVYANGRGTAYLRTQVTQNVTRESTKLMRVLSSKWGGNVTRQRTSHGVKYNWQLNSNSAVTFLKAIEPFLLLKQEQVQIGCAWWESRPKQRRGTNGRFISTLRLIDGTIIELLKKLKKNDLNTVLREDKEMVRVIKLLASVKG